MSLAVTPALAIPLEEFEFSYARSSGPGGQNVNKVNSKCVLRWRVAASPSLSDDVRGRFVARHKRQITTEGELVIASQRYRDAPRNQQDCLEKLRAWLLEAATPPKRRKKTRPTAGSRVRRRREKSAQAAKKQGRQKPGAE